MHKKPEYLHATAVVSAWVRLWDAFKVEGRAGFRESLRPDGEPFIAYNWGFGALLAAAGQMALIPGLVRWVRQYAEELWNATLCYRTDHAALSSVSRLSDSFPGDAYYDDNAWVGLAAMDLYQGLGERRWLELAIELYRWIMTTGFDPAFGAVYWREEPKTSVHVCSTGPAAILGLRLADQVGKDAWASALAMQRWLWSMRNASGLFCDHQTVADGRVDERVFSYNTGTPLEVWTLMAEREPLGDWSERALAVLRAVPNLWDNQGYPPTPWFNVVLLRALVRAGTRFLVDDLIAPYHQQMAKAWHAFQQGGGCLALPHNREEDQALLRDRAAAVETLALLYRYQRQPKDGAARIAVGPGAPDRAPGRGG
jgi:hypothetical protein